MWYSHRAKLAAGLVAFCTSGCGLATPEIGEIWDGPQGTRQIEFEIKRRVYCDLKRGIINANREYSLGVEERPSGLIIKKPFIPYDWGAQVSLSLQVDEAGALSPGLSLNRVLPNAITPFANGNVTTSQNFTFGLGGTLSSTATRIDKFDPFYTVEFLMNRETDDSPCLQKNDPFLQRGIYPAASSPLILSDLKIEEWLKDAMFTNSLLPSNKPGGSPNSTTPDTVSLETKFIIISSGNVTPTWKLVRVTANTGNSPLFSLNRTRTHDLIITLGPQKNQTSQTHFASQIGQAVSGANRSLFLAQ
jgi:hypothetical protein